MNRQQVIDLMASSRNETEWNNNASAPCGLRARRYTNTAFGEHSVSFRRQSPARIAYGRWINLSMSLALTPTGANGRIDLFGEDNGFVISSTDGTFTGTSGSDGSRCGSGRFACTLLSAHLASAAASVPEPASLALIGAGLIGLAVLRRRAVG